MSFRIIAVLSFSLLLMVSMAEQAHAQKSFWDAMFGWMKEPDNSPDPAETLQAPFAYGGASEQKNAVVEQKRTTAVPLEHAHTNEAVVGKWLIEAVSESLSYKITDTQDVYDKNAVFFSPSGLAQFRTFMEQNNIQKVLDSKRFNVRSFVKEDPLLLNSAKAEGRFRWLFEVPLMVSYMDAKDFNYKEDDPVNQHLVLTVQVGRVAQADNELGVLIETWSGKSQKIDKN